MRLALLKRHGVSCAMVLFALSVAASPDWWFAKLSKPVVACLPGGFRVTYYRDASFNRAWRRSTERLLVKDFRHSGRIGRALSWSRAVRWEGWLEVPADGDYTFFMQTAGGARLYVGDSLVLDHWDSQGWRVGQHASAALPRGSQRIRVDQRLPKEGGAIRLRWAGGPVPPNTVLGVPHVSKRRSADEP